MDKKFTRKAQVIIFKKINDEPAFLMLHRSGGKGVFWQPVTGSVEEGEDYTMGALREVEEETGIKDYLKLYEGVHSFEFNSDFNGPSQEEVFGMEVEEGVEPKLSHEHDKYKWCELEEALDLLKFESNKKALRHLNTMLK